MPNTGVEGLQLKQEEQEYLLPHFTMLLIGKPGSGKTTLLKQLITNPQMYAGKFDEIMIVSPSYAKMGIDLDDEFMTEQFSLKWIFQQIEKINNKQLETLFGVSNLDDLFEGKMTKGKPQLPHERYNGNVRSVSTLGGSGTLVQSAGSRFPLFDLIKKTGIDTYRAPALDPEEEKKVDPLQIRKKQQQDIYKKIQELPHSHKRQTHFNALLVLDDVVGSIKKAEFDPRLAQLFMNRRHLIYNGTLSIIVVSQKYTMIPARIRSNASWIITYQLNPNDFEIMYNDVVVYDKKTWTELLQFVFGNNQTMLGNYENEQEQYPRKVRVEDLIKGKKFQNLGIWIEFNIYFSNFKRLNF